MVGLTSFALVHFFSPWGVLFCVFSRGLFFHYLVCWWVTDSLWSVNTQKNSLDQHSTSELCNSKRQIPYANYPIWNLNFAFAVNQCVIEGLAVANFTIGTCATSPRFATNSATSNLWGRLAIFNDGQLLGVQTDHYKTAKLLLRIDQNHETTNLWNSEICLTLPAVQSDLMQIPTPNHP